MQTQYQYVVGSRVYLAKTVYIEGKEFPKQTAEENNSLWARKITYIGTKCHSLTQKNYPDRFSDRAQLGLNNVEINMALTQRTENNR